MVLISHTWTLVTLASSLWFLLPWIWHELKLPYAREIECADSVRKYEAAYQRAIPILRLLWICGGLIAIADHGLDAFVWNDGGWLSRTVVPSLRILAACLIGYAITLGIDLIFRGAKIAGREIQAKNTNVSPRWLSSILVGVLCHATEISGYFLIGAIAALRFNGIGSETILVVGIALILGPYLGQVTQLLDSVSGGTNDGVSK